MTRKAELTMDPRLLRTMGRTLYQGSQLFVIPRELLQNALDAIRMRFGNAPGGKLTVTIDLKFRMITVIDNGVGMSDQDITDYFLRLGASGKIGENAAIVGRFGIAKAAILSCEEWRLETGRYLLTHEILAEKGTIEELPTPREGTLIRCMIDKTYYGSLSKSQALMSILLTDLGDTELDFTFVDDDSDEPFRFSSKDGLESLIKLTSTDGTKLKFLSFPTTKIADVTLSGLDVIRVHGQVQIVQRSTTAERPINLLFDLRPEVPPDHADYPLTMSREKLKDGNTEAMVIQTEIHRMNIDILTSANSTREQEQKNKLRDKDTTKLVGGRFLRGKNKPRNLTIPAIYSDDVMEINTPSGETIKAVPADIIYDEEHDRLYIKADDGEEIDLYDGETALSSPYRNYMVSYGGKFYNLRNAHELGDFRDKINEVRKYGDKIRILKYYYEVPKDVKTLLWHSRILMAWQEICTLACADEVLGIGITSLDTKKAARHDQNGVPYYIINPVTAELNEDDPPGATALKMWHLATHESGHTVRDVHDEIFTSAHSTMALSSAVMMWEALFKIANMLK